MRYIIRVSNSSIQRTKNNQWHRLHGPAIERCFGYRAWCKNDKYHRMYYPALEDPNGRNKWYINGIQYYSPED